MRVKIHWRTRLNYALWSLIRSAAMDSVSVSWLGAVTIRSVFCAAILGSAAAGFPGNFGLYGCVTTFTFFLCIVRVNPPRTRTA